MRQKIQRRPSAGKEAAIFLLARLLLEKGTDPDIKGRQYHSTPRGWTEFSGLAAIAQIRREAEEEKP